MGTVRFGGTIISALLAAAVAACSGETAAPDEDPDAGAQPVATDAGPTCLDGQEMSEHGCLTSYAKAECPPRSAAFLGHAECQPVGRSTPCPDGFAADESGWGCTAIAPLADCPSGQVASLGSTECREVGMRCEAPRIGRWGCDLAHPAVACTGASFARLGFGDCLPLGDCTLEFPPATASYFVDASYTAGQVDATHFQTIQAALELAPEGAVIAIERGTYPEALSLSRSVTLVGRCAEQVTVDGAGLNTPGVAIASLRGVSISNLSLVNYTRGIDLSAAASLSLSNVRIESSRSAGIFAADLGTEVDVFQSVVRNTRSGSMSASGIRADNSAAITLRDVEITGTVGSGLTALGNGASVTGVNVIVRDSPLQGRVGGTGVSVQDGTLALDHALVLDSERFGLVSSGTGATATLNHVIIRGSSMFSGAGRGIIATNGGTVLGTDVDLELNSAANGLAEGTGSLLRLERATVIDALPDESGIGGGLLVQPGGTLELIESAVMFNASAGVAGVGGTVRIERSRIGASKGLYAPGIVVGHGAQLEVEDSFLGDGSGYDLQVLDSGTVARLHRTLIFETAIAALDQGRMELDASAILSARDVGIFTDVAGTEVWVKDSVIADGKSIDDPTGGNALFASNGSHVMIEDSDLDHNQNGGIYIDTGANVELIRSNVRRSQPDPEDKNGLGADVWASFSAVESAFVDNAGSGLALRLRGVSEANVERSAFLNNGVTGIYTYFETKLMLDGVTIAGSHPRADDEFGVALMVGGNVTASRSLFLRSTYAGIAFDASKAESGSDLELSSCVIAETKPDSMGFGHGLISGSNTRVRLSDVTVRNNASAGLVFTHASALVERSLIADNTIGVHVQDGSTLLEASAAPDSLGPTDVVFLHSTRLLNNGTRVGAGEIPVPELFPE